MELHAVKGFTCRVILCWLNTARMIVKGFTEQLAPSAQ